MENMFKFATAFIKDEDGAALTEYLVLLGLLIGGVVVAVTTFGENLNDVWVTWGTWVDSLDDDVPAT